MLKTCSQISPRRMRRIWRKAWRKCSRTFPRDRESTEHEPTTATAQQHYSVGRRAQPRLESECLQRVSTGIHMKRLTAEGVRRLIASTVTKDAYACSDLLHKTLTRLSEHDASWDDKRDLRSCVWRADHNELASHAGGPAQADIAFQRQFHFAEKVQLSFRGEFFSIFNHPHFGRPDNNITDTLRLLDGNVGKQSRVRWGEWRPQSPVPNQWPALDPARVKSRILKTHSWRSVD